MARPIRPCVLSHDSGCATTLRLLSAAPEALAQCSACLSGRGCSRPARAQQRERRAQGPRAAWTAGKRDESRPCVKCGHCSSLADFDGQPASHQSPTTSPCQVPPEPFLPRAHHACDPKAPPLAARLPPSSRPAFLVARPPSLLPAHYLRAAKQMVI